MQKSGYFVAKSLSFLISQASILDFGLPSERKNCSKSFKPDSSPEASPITVPFEVFCTQPVIFKKSAFFFVYFRKNTPWTFPNTSKLILAMKGVYLNICSLKSNIYTQNGYEFGFVRII